MKSLNVLDPDIVYIPVPVPVIHKLLYVKPPPAKVLDDELVSVIFIVEVPGVKVNPPVITFHTVPVPATETVNVPIESVCVNDEKLTLLADAVAVMVIVPDPELKSKTTSLLVAGTDAPDEPPDVRLQFAVLEASQFPVPPTQ